MISPKHIDLAMIVGYTPVTNTAVKLLFFLLKTVMTSFGIIKGEKAVICQTATWLRFPVI